MWMVRPGESRGRRGTLSLEEGSLTFSVQDEEPLRIGPVRRVRRLTGTPVLHVVYERDGETAEALLYFVEPLPLRRQPPLRLPRLGGGTPGRISSVAMLGAANRRLKPKLKRWEKEIRAAAERR